MTLVLLVDDHAIVRAGMRRLLAALPGVDVAEAATGPDAIAAARAARPALVVLDLNLPGLGGLVLLRRLLADHPGLRILVLSMHAEPIYAARALEAGASGYVSKNATPEELLRAIRRVLGGNRYMEAEIAQALAVTDGQGRATLNEREIEILRLLVAGQSLQQIADALGLAYKTVANACTGLKSKLGASRTADLIRLATGLGTA